MAVDAGADVLGDLALQKVRRADRELDHLETAGHLALGVVVGLAVLGRDHFGQLVGPLPQDGLEPVEDSGPTQRRRLRPCRPSCGRRGDGAVDFGGRGEGDGLFRSAGGRIENGLTAARCAGDAGVVDEMGDLGHGFASFLVPGLFDRLLGAQAAAASSRRHSTAPARFQRGA